MNTGSKKVKLYTGSYNAPVLTGDGSIYHGKGGGIRVFLFDEENGTLESLEGYPDVKNASWIAFSPDKRTLYAVNEVDDYLGTGGGGLTSFAVDGDGRLSMQNSLPVMGAAPCHVSCGQSGERVFTANYNGGSLSGFLVNEDGSLKTMDLQVIHPWEEDRPPGCSRIRQEKPHVHSASVFDGLLWVTDLGRDEIYVYELDGQGNLVSEPEGESPKIRCKATLPAGSGPRSLAFRKDGYVYLSCELSNEIGILRWMDERIMLKGLVPCTPENADAEGIGTTGADRENLPGGIILSDDEKYLYVGNRGHDSIAVFKLDETGLPQGIQWIDSGGRNPRGFKLSPSGRWLIAANQDSDNLVVFGRNRETGMLTEHARYEAGTVACLEFL